MLFKNGNNIYEHFEQTIKTRESKKFIYQFTDKLNFKNPDKNTALANLSIYYTWKNIKSEFLIQLGMITVIFLMDLILFLIYKIILNTSSKNMKLLQIILLYKFM